VVLKYVSEYCLGVAPLFEDNLVKNKKISEHELQTVWKLLAGLASPWPDNVADLRSSGHSRWHTQHLLPHASKYLNEKPQLRDVDTVVPIEEEVPKYSWGEELESKEGKMPEKPDMMRLANVQARNAALQIHGAFWTYAQREERNRELREYEFRVARWKEYQTANKLNTPMPSVSGGVMGIYSMFHKLFFLHVGPGKLNCRASELIDYAENPTGFTSGEATQARLERARRISINNVREFLATHRPPRCALGFYRAADQASHPQSSGTPPPQSQEEAKETATPQVITLILFQTHLILTPAAQTGTQLQPLFQPRQAKGREISAGEQKGNLRTKLYVSLTLAPLTF
jgi:hypothetical protein